VAQVEAQELVCQKNKKAATRLRGKKGSWFREREREFGAPPTLAPLVTSTL
jgi:hypothetical protein